MYNLPLLSYGQLANFNFSVTPTNETCTGNGMLSMNVSNTQPGAEIIYSLYLAPEFDIVIATTAAPFFLTLREGTYRVVATQFINGQSNSQQQDVVINDLIEVLDFELTDSAAIDCDVTATITVNVLAGNPTFYEIISGPMIVPLQTSNQFTNLVAGTYVVRVFDNCNDALTKTYTFFIGNNNFSIGAPVLPQVHPSCTTLELINNINSNTSAPLLYPLIVDYTIFAPDNSVAQTFLQTITSGSPTTLQLSQNINLFGDQIFTVQIEVKDNCGNTFLTDFTIDPNPKLIQQEQPIECGEFFFTLAVTNYKPPFTLNFTEPATFVPADFNSDYPGSYDTDVVTFGSIDNVVPFGDYKVTIQDDCGRTSELVFSVIKKPLEPMVSVSNSGCDSNSGTVRIQIPEDRKIVAISITQAPATYPGVLPDNVIAFVNTEGIFINNDLPEGDYSFFITDNCGDTYTVLVSVPPITIAILVATMRPDCIATSGAVRLSLTIGAIITMVIKAAPVSFTNTLPFNVSNNINSGGVFLSSSLPAGMYTFEATDICGFTSEINVEILGYNRDSSGFSINRKCGSFNITLEDTDASITGKKFWLQKFFPATNLWGHPYTGVAFVEGTILTSTASVGLVNMQTLLNIFLIGDFRIIKVFDSYADDNLDATCSDLYVEFTIAPELVILGAYNLNCLNSVDVNDVVVDVLGVEPFNFSMTSPFLIDNGENNTFLNLANGSYNFQVTDDCGNIKNIPVEIGTLLPLVRAIKPVNMVVCREEMLPFAVFPLVNQTSQILGNQNPNSYIVTYHFTQADANTGHDPLPDGYTNVSNPQIIYVRVKHKTIALCYATTSFTIITGNTPALAPENPTYLCEGFTAVLNAEAGYAAYQWSTGETTKSITVDSAGTYTVTVSNFFQGLSCEASKEYVVITSSVPTIQNISISDWSADQNSVVVSVSGSGEYVYSVDMINFQSSNTFINLPAGDYTVYVKDENGCGTAISKFVLLNYPKFFTPNGDGYNDTWHIQFSSFEPNLSVDIFDRFSKFLIRLKSGDVGWDGTYNGNILPSTDYWFVVTRQDGGIHRGHFSLKR